MCGFVGGESAPVARSRRQIIMGALLTAVAPLMAQSGRVRIVVKDASGAVIPNAEASLVGSEGTAISANEAGEILLTGLPVGNVNVVVRAQGFMPRPVTITVRNGEERKTEVTLELGTVGTVVAVPPAEITSPSGIPTLTSSTESAVVPKPQPPKKRRRWWKFW